MNALHVSFKRTVLFDHAFTFFFSSHKRGKEIKKLGNKRSGIFCASPFFAHGLYLFVAIGTRNLRIFTLSLRLPGGPGIVFLLAAWIAIWLGFRIHFAGVPFGEVYV